MANARALAVLGDTVFPLIAFFSVLKSKFAFLAISVTDQPHILR
jgi:hypothetical protein